MFCTDCEDYYLWCEAFDLFHWCGIKYIAPGIDKQAAVIANVAITKMMEVEQ
jgi:hypothetical protein